MSRYPIPYPDPDIPVATIASDGPLSPSVTVNSRGQLCGGVYTTWRCRLCRGISQSWRSIKWHMDRRHPGYRHGDYEAIDD